MAATRLRIAFHAPLKSPDHPVPSGDRKMARQLVDGLRQAGHEIEVLSQMRAWLPDPGDRAAWQRLQEEALAERVRIAAIWQARPADLVFCYHPYYKSPDLIGLPLAKAHGLPYLTCEASLSPRRNTGLWAETQALAREAVAEAALNLCLSARDAEGLAQAVPGARLARLAPFIDALPFAAPPQPEPGHIVTVAMMRPGDKLESFRHLAAALARLPPDCDWRLSVAGDGPAAAEVQALFADLPPDRLCWLGALPPDRVAALLARGMVYLWPGVGEAYGLAYLEAQAAGLPVIAFGTAGVPEVVSGDAGGALVAPGDDAGLAAEVALLLADPAEAARRGAAARARVIGRHSIEAATGRLAGLVLEALRSRGAEGGAA